MFKCWWKAYAICAKIHFTIVLQPQVVLNLFLSFDRISGSCSYEIVLIKIECNRAELSCHQLLNSRGREPVTNEPNVALLMTASDSVARRQILADISSNLSKTANASRAALQSCHWCRFRCSINSTEHWPSPEADPEGAKGARSRSDLKSLIF